MDFQVLITGIQTTEEYRIKAENEERAIDAALQIFHQDHGSRSARTYELRDGDGVMVLTGTVSY